MKANRKSPSLKIKMPSLKKPFINRKRLKHGSYSIAMTGIVVAGAVVLNLIASEIPSQYTEFDLSSNQLSVIGTQTKEVLAGLTEDITIYYIVQDTNKDTYVERLLNRYDDLSSHATVVEKDPVLYPKFVSQYTDDSLSENSLIVECGDRSRVVSYSDMYEAEFNYSYYTYETTGFDAEGQITSAIAAVSSDALPKLYTMTGHGEMELGDTFTAAIEKANIETESLNLITADQVPEDADCVLLISPTSDITAEEAEKLLTYLQGGGKAMILTDYTGEDMANLESVLEYYGTEIVDGVVLEGDNNYYIQVPYYLVPDISSTEVSSDLTGGAAYVLLAAAQGITESDEIRDGVDVTSVLSTSSQAYSKTDIENMTTYDKEDGDVDGPFDLGVIISETVEIAAEAAAAESDAAEESAAEAESDAAEDSTEESADVSVALEAETAETKLALFTSSALVDESANQMVSGGNETLFMNTISWLCGQTSAVSVPVKSLSMDYLTVTAASGSFWSIMVIAVIPGAFLIYGLFVWLRRRKQ